MNPLRQQTGSGRASPGDGLPGEHQGHDRAERAGANKQDRSTEYQAGHANGGLRRGRENRAPQVRRRSDLGGPEEHAALADQSGDAGLRDGPAERKHHHHGNRDVSPAGARGDFERPAEPGQAGDEHDDRHHQEQADQLPEK